MILVNQTFCIFFRVLFAFLSIILWKLSRIFNLLPTTSRQAFSGGWIPLAFSKTLLRWLHSRLVGIFAGQFQQRIRFHFCFASWLCCLLISFVIKPTSANCCFNYYKMSPSYIPLRMICNKIISDHTSNLTKSCFSDLPKPDFNLAKTFYLEVVFSISFH